MQNLLDPAILFFVFGVMAGLVRSNLEIPQPIARFLALYLLMALGLKGGFALAHTGLTPDVARSLGAALLLAVAVWMVSPVLPNWAGMLAWGVLAAGKLPPESGFNVPPESFDEASDHVAG